MELDPTVYKELLSKPGNAKCIDCGDSTPDWGSPKLGILFCLECAGKHRGLGTYVSFVRSVAMDSWTEKEIEFMRKGGNQQCKDFLEGKDLSFKDNPTPKERYDTPEAELYRLILKARVENTPEPTELPKPYHTQVTKTKTKMQGFGSTPMPPQQKVADYRPALALVGLAVVGAAGWMMLHKT